LAEEQNTAHLSRERLAPHETQGKEVKKMAKDPVCGMEVDEKKAPAKSQHIGKTYYFCAPAQKGV